MHSGTRFVVVYVCTCVYIMPGLKLKKDQNGFICMEDPKGDPDRQAFGSHKATSLLYFTARSMALAGWADVEALTEFYEALLEVFWTSPAEGFVGPSVEDLRKCEQAAWRQTVRLMLTSRCSLDAALQNTAQSLAGGLPLG